jgi:GNAT superfamily N-acetyltransferase
MTLVRLAVDKGHQRKGRGQALLEDLKTLRIRGRESPRIDVFDPRKRLS